MKELYHKVMLRINSFLFGHSSINAHKHFNELVVINIRKGFKKGV